MNTNLQTANPPSQPPPGSGTHRKDDATSVEAVLAALIPAFVLAAIYIAIFVAIRDRYPWIYSPRTHTALIPKKDRTPVQGLGKYDWFQTFRMIEDRFVLRHQGLDVYLWLRFLKTSIFLCFIGTCLTWPVLFAVNATGGGTSKELDRISFSNVTDKKKLYAHATIAWVFLGLVMYTVAKERIFLRELRQAYYLSKRVSGLLSSRTVLYLHASEDMVNHDDNDLEQTLGEGARKHWAVTDLSDIEKLVSERSSDAMSLEDSQVALVRTWNKKRLNSGRKPFNANMAGKAARPQHHLFPLVGEKVDSINWYRDNVTYKAEKINDARNSYSETPKSGRTAVFVEYATQAQARKAYHQFKFGGALHMDPRFIGLQPKEVLWSNLGQAPAARLSKKAAASGLVAAIIIFWSIPVGIVGTISNINYLTDKIKWLRFIDDLPPAILGLITGLLPPFLLSWLVKYVPKFFRKLARRFEPTTSSSELLTQAWYFAFQLIQVFLVTTFASGATTVATRIAQNPKSVPDLLAQNLPKASNFYITYFILQGLSSSAQNVLRYDDLSEYFFYDYFFDNTPRKKYERYTWMKGISWGTVYPKFANFLVIAIVYSTIAPLVLGFATAGIWLYYLSYRYNLLFTIQAKIDTRGDAYGLALQHVTAGVYLSELCLLGLFGARGAAGPAAMMVVALVATALAHVGMNRLLKPLERYMPKPLRQEDEEAPLINGEEDEAAADDDDEGHETMMTRVRRSAPGWVPSLALGLFERFLMPSRDAQREMREWFEQPDVLGGDVDDDTRPTEEQLENAYVNPALTSKTPKLWLLRDDMGISAREGEENEKAGITTTDEGAELDDKNHVVWDTRDGAGNVPAFKKPVRY